jgi:hypothetical protein
MKGYDDTLRKSSSSWKVPSIFQDRPRLYPCAHYSRSEGKRKKLQLPDRVRATEEEQHENHALTHEATSLPLARNTHLSILP